MAAVMLLPGGVWQESPGWFWIILASPIVAIIILFFMVLLAVLLILLWQRAKRQRRLRAGEQPPVPPPIAMQDTVPAPAVEADITEVVPTVAVEAEAEDKPTKPTIPVTRTEGEPETVPVSGQRPANIGWHIAGLTDVGLKRDHNEDNMLMIEAVMPDATPYGLYVVADGLGGHQGGEIASQLTVDAIQKQFTQHPPMPAAAPFEDWLKEAAMAANLAVLDHQEDQNQAKKMGSTLVMALVAAGQAHIANVGDSRAYRLNDEDIQQISVDHSLVERLVQIGQLTREEARTHRNRNVIYNTIGDKPEMEISLYHVSLQPGDRLLLCSDGLSDMITDEEILETSRRQPDPAKACQAMVEGAKLAGGNDNITTIIVQMDE